MKRLVFVLLFLPVLYMGATFFFAGVDVSGHVFPFIGFGTSVGESDFLSVRVGVTKDGEIFAYELDASYFYVWNSIWFGLSFSTISALSESEFGDASISPSSFLFLLGPRLGYTLSIGGIDLDITADVYFTLPFGAVDEFKFPIPFLSFGIGKDKGF